MLNDSFLVSVLCRTICRCIPYRYKSREKGSLVGEAGEEVEVLVISSQKGKGLLFPKVNNLLPLSGVVLDRLN